MEPTDQLDDLKEHETEDASLSNGFARHDFMQHRTLETMSQASGAVVSLDTLLTKSRQDIQKVSKVRGEKRV